MLLLGVNPKKQGKGYAKLLLNKILGQYDSENMPCYCETYLPKNVTIYQKFGFEVVKESEIPKTNIKFWDLLRKPHLIDTSCN
jgi:GNAT superfamily N-acetyltransferase